MATNLWSENLTTQRLLNENDTFIPHNKVTRSRRWENRVELANDEMHSPNNYWEATGTRHGCWGLGGSHWIRDEDPCSHGSGILISGVCLLSPCCLLFGGSRRRWKEDKSSQCAMSTSEAAHRQTLSPCDLMGGFLSYLFSSCSFFCYWLFWCSMSIIYSWLLNNCELCM